MEKRKPGKSTHHGGRTRTREDHETPRRGPGSNPPDPHSRTREDHEPPRAVAEWGWRYHHIGIPTDERRPGEQRLAELGISVTGFDTSPYGVEWMRFEPDSPVPEIIRTIPHVAFEVDDLEEALAGKTLIGPISSPSEGVRVAMILHDGAPVELIEFAGKRGG